MLGGGERRVVEDGERKSCSILGETWEREFQEPCGVTHSSVIGGFAVMCERNSIRGKTSVRLEVGQGRGVQEWRQALGKGRMGKEAWRAG